MEFLIFVLAACCCYLWIRVLALGSDSRKTRETLRALRLEVQRLRESQAVSQPVSPEEVRPTKKRTTKAAAVSAARIEARPAEPTDSVAFPASAFPAEESGRRALPPHPGFSELVLALVESAFRATASALTTTKNWLLGGSTVLRAGMLLLFIGLAFLTHYASERISEIELRYIGMTCAGLVLLALGWWLRFRTAIGGLALQGAGVATLYLTGVAAARLHALLPQTVVFALLALFAVVAMVLAVSQDAVVLACVAALGGFAAPVLVASNSHHVALFSYFALINAGLLLLAWFKAWRILTPIGFVATFGLVLVWEVQRYVPDFFTSTEPFLILFFLMYAAAGILFARSKLLAADNAPDDEGRHAMLRWSVERIDSIDIALIFGPPLVGFGLQYAIIHTIAFGTAFSALALALFYLILAYGLHRQTRTRLLMEFCVALGVAFVTLATPLAFKARGMISAIWAVEAAGIHWLALARRRPLARYFSLTLMAASALCYLWDTQWGGAVTASVSNDLPTLLTNSPPGAALLGAALLFCHCLLRRTPEERLTPTDRFCQPILAGAALFFLYLVAPLLFDYEATAIAWALAGALTFFVGLRWNSPVFFGGALLVQGLAILLFLGNLRGISPFAAVDSSGTSVLLWLVGDTSGLGALVSATLGAVFLFAHAVLRRLPEETLTPKDRFCQPILAGAALFFLYLVAPLLFDYEATAIAWALVGALTFFVGLRWNSPVFFGGALLVQMLAIFIFLGNLRGISPFGSSAGTQALLWLVGDTSGLGALVSAILGAVFLFAHVVLRRLPEETLTPKDRFCQPILAGAALFFLYLVAPLLLDYEATVIAWALAGALTFFVGLRWNSPVFFGGALLVQLLGIFIFLGNLRGISPFGSSAGTQVLLWLAGDTSGFGAVVSAILGAVFLFAYAILRRISEETLTPKDRFCQPILAGVALFFLYLVAPLLFDYEATVIAWALAGAFTFFVGLRWNSRVFFGGALLVQLLAIFIFLGNLRGIDPFGPSAGTQVLLWLVEDTGGLGAIVSAILGAVFLFAHVVLRHLPEETLTPKDRFCQPILAGAALFFLYLVAPLLFDYEVTVVAWALAGALTFFVGLRWNSRVFFGGALLVQILAIFLFLGNLRAINPFASFDPSAGMQVLLWLAGDTSSFGAAVSATLGAVFLFAHVVLRHLPEETLTPKDRFCQPILAGAALFFLYLVAPLLLDYEDTVVAWALAGALTFFVGLRWNSRVFFGGALLVQILAIFLFLGNLRAINPFAPFDISTGMRTLFWLVGDTSGFGALVSAILGAVFLFAHAVLRRLPKETLTPKDRFCQPILAGAALFFLYMVAPLRFGYEGTVIAWALAGSFTFFVGLRWNLRVFYGGALLVQLLAIFLFLGNLQAVNPFDPSAGTRTLLWLAGDTSHLGVAVSAILGAVFLFAYAVLRRLPEETLTPKDRFCQPILAGAALFFLYLVAPLRFGYEATVIAWALAGALTFFVGLRWNLRVFYGGALLIQGLTLLLFLGNLRSGEESVLVPGSMGILCALIAGVALIVIALVARKDALAREGRAARRWNLILLAGLAHVNLAPLFALEWNGVCIGWAVSGLLIICLWPWQTQRVVLYFGTALEALAGASFLYFFGGELQISSGYAPAALALAAFLGAWRIHHIASRVESDRILTLLANLLLAWGLLWWIWAIIEYVTVFTSWIDDPIPFAYLLRYGGDYLVLFTLSVSACLWTAVARWTHWRMLALSAYSLPLVAALCLMLVRGEPLVLGVPAWIAFFLGYLAPLRFTRELIPAWMLRGAHIVGAWLFVDVAALMIHDAITGAELANAWVWLGWALTPALYLWLTSGERGQFWPFKAFSQEYRVWAALPMMLAMLAWFWIANFFSTGDATPLPYLPLLNPLELGLLLALLVCWHWVHTRFPQIGKTGTIIAALAGGISLLALITLSVCRAAHAWGDVPFYHTDMMASMEVQASWSLAWALFAFALMIGGNLRGLRSVWMAGGALIALVVAKLFFVELSGHGSLARIISFIGVGALLLVVGHFFHYPGHKREKNGQNMNPEDTDSTLTQEEVRKIAQLAHIEISEAEAENTLEQLNGIFSLIGEMQAVDTRGVEPMAHAQDLAQRLREDRVTETNRREVCQTLAPETQSGLYLVPKVIE